MFYSVTNSSVRVVHVGEPKTTFSGSSSYFANSPSEVFINRRDRLCLTSAPKNTEMFNEICRSEKKPISCSKARTYKLNKSKIRAKMNAFFNLQATREFCAFYSISFPCGFSDDDAFKVFNLWLTRCRQSYALKSYIWVQERQKNGTIHFHILTNTRMPIKEINRFMRVALTPYSHLYGWNPSKVGKYNGVDVDNVWYPKQRPNRSYRPKRTRDDAARHLSKYISKYVSKNNETFSRLAWHESRDIAALFTAQNYDESECTMLLNYFRETMPFWKKISGEFITVYLHPTTYNLTPYTDLAAVNEKVYQHFLEHG